MQEQMAMDKYDNIKKNDKELTSLRSNRVHKGICTFNL